MRALIVVAVLVMAGCQFPSAAEMHAADARRVCAQNGHAPGAPGFDRCFEATFAAINGVRN